MRDSILIKILKTFNSKDISDFRKFLQSPFHTESKVLLDFFDYLRRFQPEYNSHRLKKENLFKQLFSDKNYTEKQANKRLTNMISQLKQLVEEYLALREHKKDKVLQKRLLIRAYHDIDDYELFKGQLKEGVKALKKVKKQDENYYLDKMLLHYLEYQHPQTYLYDKNGESIQATMSSLDDFFMLSRLKIGMNLAIRQQLFSGENHVNFLKKVRQSVQKKDVSFNPRVQLYDLVIECFQKSFNIEDYFRLKEAFMKTRAFLTLKEQKDTWTCLFNYYTRLVREDDNIDRREVWELQKIALEYGILLENGRMMKTVFENIVIVSCFFQEFAWTEKFIQNFTELLSNNQRDNCVNFSWTYYYFYKEEFEKVISLLQEIKFTDASYKSRTRSLLLRSYYKLIDKNDKYYEAFLSLSYSFEKYLRRDTSRIDNYKKGYINFIIIMRLLAKHKTSLGYEDYIEEIEKKMNAMKYLVTRPWVEEEIAKIKKRR